MNRLIPLLTLLVAALAPLTAQSSAPEIVVEVGGTVTIPAPGFQKSVVIDADKADFEVLPDGIRVRGKELGQTKVVVWDADGRTHPYMVSVVAAGELDRQRERSLRDALDADPLTREAGIRVAVAGDAAILSGEVASQAVIDRALELVRPRVATVTSELRVAAGTAPAPRPTPVGDDLPPLPAPGTAPTATPVRHSDTPPLAGMPRLGVKLDDIGDGGALQMSVGEARLVSVPTEMRRALIADDSIADVVLIPPREVAVIAKQPGTTTLMLWYIGPDAFLNQQLNASIDVNIVGPPEGAAPGNLPTSEEVDRVLELLGITDVQVITRYDATAPSVILGGTVPSALHRARAEQAIAALFPAQTRISNFLEIARPEALKPEALAAREAQLEKLLAEQLPNAAVRVRLRGSNDGTIRVLLSGDAPVPADRLKAEQVVQFELGPSAVITNNITTPIPPPPEELLGAEEEPEVELPPFGQALAQAIELTGVRHDRVYVDIFDEPRKRVVLRGNVRTEDEQADLIEAVLDVIDVYGGEYELRDRGLVVKTARVVTEVEIVELTASDAQQLGVTYGTVSLGTQDTGGGGGGGGTNSTSTVSNSNGQITVYGESPVGSSIRRLDPIGASVQALITNNKARVLSQPNITSNDTQQGVVEIVTEVPLPSTTTTTGGAVGTSVEFRPVGIRLLVTPRILWGDPTNQIEMSIETEVSAVDFGIAINIGGAVIPGVTNRSAETVVTVDDGETLVIGGLTTETERKNVSRLPFLSSIPIIGELFKSTDSRTEQTTVVVVMTPRIKW